MHEVINDYQISKVLLLIATFRTLCQYYSANSVSPVLISLAILLNDVINNVEQQHKPLHKQAVKSTAITRSEPVE